MLLVGSVCYRPTAGDVESNLSRALDLAHEAWVTGARLIVLPELAASGQVRDRKAAAYVAQSHDGYQTRVVAEWAERRNCTVVFGYVERGDGNFYNSAVVVDPTGVRANFRKRNLMGSDALWATRGEESPMTVVNCVWGRLGVLIGRDILNRVTMTEGPRFYTPGSIDAIALPAAWIGDYDHPDAAWVDLARELNCTVAVANTWRDAADKPKMLGGCCVVNRASDVYADGSEMAKDCYVVGDSLL